MTDPNDLQLAAADKLRSVSNVTGQEVMIGDRLWIELRNGKYSVVGPRGGVTTESTLPESFTTESDMDAGAEEERAVTIDVGQVTVGEPDSDLPAPDTEGLGEGGSDSVDTNEEPEPSPVIDSTAEEIALEIAPQMDDGETPADYAPPEAELAVRGPDDVYRAMDRNDEMAILSELQGRALPTLLYSFEQGSKRLTDLSWNGVNEVIRQMNERGGCQIGISTNTPPVVDEFSEPDESGEMQSYYRVMVLALDARYPGAGRWGTAVEPKMMKRRDGKRTWDKFALTKALNKAQRNALRAMIPEDFRRTLIAQFLGTPAAAKTLTPIGTGEVADLPPPLTDEKAETLKVEIREAYDELKSIDRLVMPPGRYNAILTQVEGQSHARMEDFLAHIRSLLETAKEEKS